VKGAAVVVVAAVEGPAAVEDEAATAVVAVEDVAVADPAAEAVAEAATKLELRLLASVPEFETRTGVTTSVALLF
jgi:hypothetical protein